MKGHQSVSEERIPDFSQGRYATPPNSSTRFGRTFPNLVFYARMIKIVFNSSSLAKRGRYDDQAWVRASLGIIAALESVGVHFEISGIDNFSSTKEPLVFIANHMSVLETFILSTMIVPSRRVTFVVKKSLVEMPVFRYIMRSREPVVVGRKNPRKDLTVVLEEGCAKLQEGISMIIFPQATRSLIFKPEEFNSLGIKLVKRAGVQVVPLALKTDAWGQGKLIKDFGRISNRKVVHFAFGKPMSITGNGAQEHQKIIDYIRTKLSEWQKSSVGIP
jgi:1-acyl-sn-glycerol-3-phosphate acyltransferase